MSAFEEQIKATEQNVEKAAQLGNNADTDVAFIKETGQIASLRRQTGEAFDATVAAIQKSSMAQIEDISGSARRELSAR